MKEIGLLVISLAALHMVACGDDDASDGTCGTSCGGTVTEDWADFCLATFTEATSVQDFFGDPLFTAKSDEQYLMSTFRMSFGEARAQMYYLTASAPIEFDVEPGEDGSFPFTSNCEIDEGQTYFGVFKSTTFYLDEALSQQACSLPAGTVALGGGGYSLVSEIDFTNPNQASTYEITMGGLAEVCDGHATTYVSVRPTQTFGTHRLDPPVAAVIGP
jgi:hypothetical protein